MRSNHVSQFRCLSIFVLLLIASLTQTGCESKTAYAPVENAWYQPQAKTSYYRVRKGDTLYSIAWEFGLDYRALAAVNHLKPPYSIKPGQRLRMTAKPPKKKPSKRAVQKKKLPPVVSIEHQQKQTKTSRLLNWKPKIKIPSNPIGLNSITKDWRWPARGRVTQSFSKRMGGDQGIDIAGTLGEPVRAAKAGTVVYSGAGVRGYGNLIIIKHSDSYLSAYAYNQKLLVTVGERVRAGQQIATMGQNNAGQTLLHFEIRRDGKPVNPQSYLRS